MKNLRKWTFYLLALLSISVAYSQIANAQVPYSGSTGSVSGASIVGTGGTTETLPTTTDTIPGLAQNNTYTGQTLISATGTFGQGTNFSTNPLANPLVQMTQITIPIASVNASGGQVVLGSATGRTIFPLGLTMMASGGNAATTSGFVVLCSTSGKIIASIPAGGFISGIPFNPYSSVSGLTTGTPTWASNGMMGCNSGDAVIVSNNGSSATTITGLLVNLPSIVTTGR